MLIINAKINTMEKDRNYKLGFIQIKDDKIIKIGKMSELDKSLLKSDEIIDAKEKQILPGFIDAHCHIGMWEDGLGFEGDDGNEETDPITPQLNAVDAINPMDYCFQEAYEAGITTVLTGPGSANPISGHWCAMKTCGKRIDDLIVKEKVGMKFALGENPKTTYHGKGETPVTRMAIASLIREQLTKAQRYIADKEKAKKDKDYDEPEYDVKCEELIPVLTRKEKAFFHAHRADDIFTAIRISKQFNLDYVLVHCTEGHKIADILKQEKSKVIAGPIICDRSKPELREMSVKNAKVLVDNGVKTAICTDHPVIPIQYLNISGGLCVREGLDYNECLKMLTIIPAKICGISDRVGSLKEGKDADLVMYDNDPLSVYTKPVCVIIQGKVVYNDK